MVVTTRVRLDRISSATRNAALTPEVIVGDQIVQGKTTACTACHAPDLMGVGDVPPIAGRSPAVIWWA